MNISRNSETNASEILKKSLEHEQLNVWNLPLERTSINGEITLKLCIFEDECRFVITYIILT